MVNEKTIPRDRSEQEIASYQDVLTTIHDARCLQCRGRGIDARWQKQ
ncbi:MAG: hypothetical protein MUE44_28780 [Oscillatoriaceae cyanobacterium Prado104]|nr:hypothetical protein [Oscillatoriaceae cyanobacterium Prado104]